MGQGEMEIGQSAEHIEKIYFYLIAIVIFDISVTIYEILTIKM